MTPNLMPFPPHSLLHHLGYYLLLTTHFFILDRDILTFYGNFVPLHYIMHRQQKCEYGTSVSQLCCLLRRKSFFLLIILVFMDCCNRTVINHFPCLLFNAFSKYFISITSYLGLLLCFRKQTNITCQK